MNNDVIPALARQNKPFVVLKKAKDSKDIRLWKQRYRYYKRSGASDIEAKTKADMGNRTGIARKSSHGQSGFTPKDAPLEADAGCVERLAMVVDRAEAPGSTASPDVEQTEVERRVDSVQRPDAGPAGRVEVCAKDASRIERPITATIASVERSAARLIERIEQPLVVSESVERSQKVVQRSIRQSATEAEASSILRVANGPDGHNVIAFANRKGLRTQSTESKPPKVFSLSKDEPPGGGREQNRLGFASHALYLFLCGAVTATATLLLIAGTMTALGDSLESKAQAVLLELAIVGCMNYRAFNWQSFCLSKFAAGGLIVVSLGLLHTGSRSAGQAEVNDAVNSNAIIKQLESEQIGLQAQLKITPLNRITARADLTKSLGDVSRRLVEARSKASSDETVSVIKNTHLARLVMRVSLLLVNLLASHEFMARLRILRRQEQGF